MHKSALAGLSLLTLTIISTNTAKTSALDLLELQDSPLIAVALSDSYNAAQLAVESQNATHNFEEAPIKQTKKVVLKHTVKKGDTLSTIAKRYDTTWKRMFDKNKAIKNPDVIIVGQRLSIPSASERLKSRPMPKVEIKQATPVESQPQVVRRSTVRKTTPVLQRLPQRVSRGTSSGNLYTPGNCTWYVKSRRPDLPNNLGNADTWVWRARAQGIPTGSTPRAGAVGQRGMHVVYVKSVNRDGTVNIIEMNHKGLYVITERTLPGNYFSYIY